MQSTKTDTVRDAKPKDATEIADIYNYYILNTIITFEEDTIDTKEIQERIASTIPELPWIVYEEEGEILGYAYASRWKSRCAYKHSVESTVYLKQGVLGKGIGTTLYTKLIQRLRKTGLRAVIGGIALPNDPSIRLHEKLGFEKVAQFKEVGHKFGKWIDVGYWELIFPENEH